MAEGMCLHACVPFRDYLQFMEVKTVSLVIYSTYIKELRLFAPL